ncbi:hypothetical protein FOZ60_015585 [Perkinsus olseni]|uniref:Uncharacterized protein n=1 Tax=Perkinsus olseni TaxID=32597 RepID=A0A7J6N549_PEROL|nr:hypothetical protein FOZ60_015585 [Perkinsus olseni]
MRGCLPLSVITAVFVLMPLCYIVTIIGYNVRRRITDTMSETTSTSSPPKQGERSGTKSRIFVNVSILIEDYQTAVLEDLSKYETELGDMATEADAQETALMRMQAKGRSIISLPPVQGAVEALRCLDNCDVEVCLVGVLSQPYPIYSAFIYLWVKKNIGADYASRLSLIKESSLPLLKGVALISDTKDSGPPAHGNLCRHYGKHVMLTPRNSSTINEPEGYRLNKWFTSSEEAFDFVQHIKSDSKAWSFVSTGDGS